MSTIGALLVAVTMIAGCSQSGAPDGAVAGVATVAQLRVDATGAVTPVEPSDPTDPANPAGDGTAVCPPVSIAMAGPLDGRDGGMGAPIRNGIQLAVDQHNAANERCQVQLKPFDTGEDTQSAQHVAGQIVQDAYTIGLVGPMFSGEVAATGDVFNQAGLVAATPAATDSTLGRRGWRTFFRGLASDAEQGAAVAHYLKQTLGNRKVCVVDDSTADGVGLADVVRQKLGPVADPGCDIAVKTGDTDYSAVAQQIKDAGPDSVFFSGLIADAGPFSQQIRDSGFSGALLTADGSKVPPWSVFADEYSAKFGEAPGLYSAEGYDLGTILLKGIDSGAITRPDLLQFVRSYRGRGVARTYQWDDAGELVDADVWIYQAS